MVLWAAFYPWVHRVGATSWLQVGLDGFVDRWMKELNVTFTKDKGDRPIVMRYDTLVAKRRNVGLTYQHWVLDPGS